MVNLCRMIVNRVQCIKICLKVYFHCKKNFTIVSIHILLPRYCINNELLIYSVISESNILYYRMKTSRQINLHTLLLQFFHYTGKRLMRTIKVHPPKQAIYIFYNINKKTHSPTKLFKTFEITCVCVVCSVFAFYFSHIYLLNTF